MHLTDDEYRALLAIRECRIHSYGEVTIGWRAGKLCKLERRLPSDLTAPLPAPEGA